ncbi:MAG: Heme exporter protein [Hydrocarboniphaga sp.]|uniref:heme exporter protein CcmD n=1 Tax=Hydrocarboniphaga sp. TaxID=2033016 RepID=UPI00260C5349|nr:heme exporter protein CcmD [Hydrocarboniphaga sp.]MDB5971098.1 Heme exporter protein [Hydrocarboniphaga sp.]
MSEFIAMGGYAPYVWGSFGVFAAVVIWNVLTPGIARAGVMRKLTEDEDTAGEHE